MQLPANTLLQGGKYRIIKCIGQGGFGITYEAMQSGLDRKVAIKEFFMKDFCEREDDATHVTIGTRSSRDMVANYRNKFIKEAKTIAALNNAHIIRIYDIFEENNTTYYVMEYLGGGSLKEKSGLGKAVRSLHPASSRRLAIHPRPQNHAPRRETVEHHAATRRRSGADRLRRVQAV